MNNRYYIYAYWRLDNDSIFYIGKGKNDRWKRLDRYHNKHFMNIINNYKIAVTILKDNLTESEAFYWEEKIIDILVFEYGYSIDIKNNRGDNNYLHLVNCTWGGEGISGHIHSEETKVKIGKKSKERNQGENHPFYNRSHTEETKEKISKSMKEKYTNGYISPFYGHHHTDKWRIEHSELMSGENNGMYGKHHTEETKQKMSIAQKGKKLSEEHKINLSINHADVSGENNPFYGKHHTEETKQKISESNKGKGKPIICLTTKRMFKTVADGAKYYNTQSSSISSCCKGKLKTSGKLKDGTKLTWRYINWKHNKIYRIIKKV